MYVCSCNAITDTQIQDAIDDGAGDLWALQRETGIASGCGSCRETAAEMLREARAANSDVQPARYVPKVG